MRGIAPIAMVILLPGASARADVVSQRWAGRATPCTHANTLTTDRSGQALRLVFDLSALPRRAKVYHASLFCFTRGGGQPMEPARVVPAGAKQPLTLEPPWYGSFDATQAVGRAAGGGKRTVALTVERFEDLEAGRCFLDIRFEGKSAEVPTQVAGVKAAHHDGQTFVIWAEAEAFRPPPDKVIWVNKFSSKHEDNELADGPGEDHLGHPRLPAVTLKTLRNLQGLDSKNAGRAVKIFRVRKVPELRYRIYRHSEKITAANIKDAELLGEQGPLNAYDEVMKRISYRGEFLNQQEVADSIIPTFCYDDHKPVLPGEGLFVHTPTKPGRSYYAVTAVLAGTENAAAFSDANSLAQPVDEKVAPPRPVAQRVQVNKYNKDVPEYWFTFWPAPPLANLPGRNYHIIVTVPKTFKAGDPMVISPFGRTFNLVNHLVKIPSKNSLRLFVQNQLGYFGTLCYSSGYGTLKSFRQSKVDYFGERYLLSTIRWCQDKWKPQRSGLHGTDLHFCVRHPEIFGFLTFGSYTATYDTQWAPGCGSLRRYLGPRETAVTADGLPAWEQFNLTWYVKTYPGRDIPFLFLVSGTGKDGGHTSEFGWQDDPRGWAGLRDARQNFVAFWARPKAQQVYRTIPRMKWASPVPAFTNCSLDDNPGSGDPADGDPFGQINGWLLWQPDDIVDQQDRWEMTVYVASDCAEQACTVDITPRHLKKFKPKPGQTFTWTNTAVNGAKPPQSGTVTANKWSLVTLKQVAVTKAKNRIKIIRAEN